MHQEILDSHGGAKESIERLYTPLTDSCWRFRRITHVGLAMMWPPVFAGVFLGVVSENTTE